MITNGQGTATATAATLCQVNPGPGVVLISNAGTASPVYVGMGTSVSVTSGFPVPSGAPVAFPTYAGNLGGAMHMVVASGSATVGWLISNAYGQTGTGSLG